jgi:3-hydroxybutyryl-CoA dehydratase
MSFTPAHLYLDDVEVGQEWESLGRTVTETDIVNFAGLSGDFNPIHLDHHFARSTAFRRPIAQGLLVLSMCSGLGLYSPPMRTLAFMQLGEWHFREPVFIGDTLRLRTKVLAKEVRGRGRRGVITWQRQVVNEAGKVVQEGVTQTMVEGRGPKREPSGSRPPAAEERQDPAVPAGYDKPQSPP